ncbi:MAG: carbohydrate ABC transporter permease [Clostridiaceae bacterium]|nr:carbohydrate ABC transporter permease [Clostridiaceae bacterium]MDY3071126.1 carbohydrate ABC transporter permease [Eubacteriales bacterium]MDY3286934.1 carbohydrate ABC transporter permease [Eubacteriales bacterium]MDY5015067.1 carbohydrate ABC transporter permease [Eubacteriales bacterium]
MSSRIRSIREDRIFSAFIYTIVTLLTITVLYPIIYIISSSFSSGTAVSTGQVVLWPVDFSIEGYKRVFQYSRVWIGYRNTIFYTIVGTINNVLMTLICAYPLSRRELPGRKYFMFIFVFTMYFSGGLIPSYLLMKSIGYVNTIWAMIMPGAFGVYQMIVCRTFINSTIPSEMLEAAKIDGCSDFRYFTLFVVPLSKAIIAVMTLQYAVGHWNAYFGAFIYLTNKQLFPLQIFLREILVMNQVSASDFTDEETRMIMQGMADLLKYSLIVVATAPIMCFYPFIQKYFVQGIMIGSLKG